MQRLVLPLVLVASALVGFGCSRAESEKEGSFRLIDADGLVALQADTAHPVHVYDANNDEFRKEEGIIPGAVLLKDHDWDLATLPGDTAAPLVVYCSNKL
jgi:hypothetical protein